MDNEWVTVAEAAEILGTSKQAIRQRIYRETIEHRKDPEGTVYVHITPHNEETNAESYGETLGDIGGVSRELVEELRDRVRSLENQLEHERRANAEHRRLLARALELVPPQLEAPTEPREGHETATENTGKGGAAPPEQEQRSWWQRLFS